MMVLKRSRFAEYWPSGRDKSVTGPIHPDWIDIDLEDDAVILELGPEIFINLMNIYLVICYIK